jgi:hypothetical protein
VLAFRQVFQQRVEQPAGVGLAQLQLAHLEGIGAGRHREHPEGLARELAVGAAPGFDGGLGHRQGAADALVVVGEQGHQHVGHLHRADAGGVAHAGAAVDEHVVVVLAQAGLDGLQEGAAAQALVEGIPVEGVQLGGVARPLAAGGQEVDAAAFREAGEVDAQEIGRQVGQRQVPVVALALPGRLDGLVGVVRQQVNQAARGGQLLVRQEGVEIAVQAGGFQIPVHQQHALAVGGQHPGQVGHRHGTAGAALVGIEGEDAAAAVAWRAH